MSQVVLQLIAVQVLLPLGLIAANTFLPAATGTGLAARTAAIALSIVYALVAGLWLFPPRWTAYVLLVLHLAGSLFAYRRFARSKRPRKQWLRWAERIVGVGAAAVAVVFLLAAISGRARPAGAVDLAMPLGAGRYLVTSGGAARAINAHLMTLEGERFRDYRGQSYAADLIGVDQLGFHARGIAPSEPEAYLIYGAEILAPCTGAILAAKDGLPDMRVPLMDREHLAGNHVLLGCEDVIVVLAHMAPGSVKVAAGQKVMSGDLLGRVGNSGNTAEPHLHIHVQRGAPEGAPLGGEPLWFTINGRFPVRNDTLAVP